MELLQLKYFRELAQSQHLSKTAEKLHIAQPSLSQTLRRLETELDTPLFDRIGKRIVLNDYGKILLKYTNEILQALDNAVLEIETTKKTENKTVSLHVYSASMLLPALIQTIQNVHPDIRLQIFQQPIAGEHDAPSLYLTSSHLCPDDPDTILLMKEPLVAALPRKHPLAAKKELCLTDLKNEQFVSMSQTSNLFSVIRYYCSQHQFVPQITTLADNPSMVRDLLRLNLGIAFIPAYTWQGFASETVVLKPVYDMPMSRYLLLSWDANRFQTPAMEQCKELITRYFTEYSLLCQSQWEG